MPAIRLDTHLEIPPSLAFDALSAILTAVASRSGPWEGFALHISLGDAGFPNVGYIAVPISLKVGKRNAALQKLTVSISALHHPESFPVFAGTIGIDCPSSAGATLCLEGSYDVPLDAIGKMVNATLLRGIATHALSNLIDDLAVALTARIQNREADFARYRMFAR